MHFSSGIVRPPYEAYSTFLQVTSGCSHNKCRFCTFYKDAPFCVSPESEIREDLAELRATAWLAERLYLQGADPFLLSYEKLRHIADLIHEYLPSVQSIGGYGRVDSVKNKSVEQLTSSEISYCVGAPHDGQSRWIGFFRSSIPFSCLSAHQSRPSSAAIMPSSLS